MPTPSLLFAGLVVVLVAGFVAWTIRRRSTPVARAVRVAPAPEQERALVGQCDAAIAAGDADASAPAGADGGDAPQPAVILHRLHAVALDVDVDAILEPATAPGAGHAAVAAAAETILSNIEAQARYSPRRPLLLPQLMRTVNDPAASAHAIAAIIGQDPALAAKLLRIASSPIYRVQSKPVDSIERAVAMVGTDGIRQIIAAALVQPVMGTGGGVFGGFPELAWDHTLRSAVAAAEHAKRVERDDGFAAQLLALLYGLGSIIVVKVVSDQYARRPALVPDAGLAATLLATWTAPTARRIAGRWELSERIGAVLDEQQRGLAPGDMDPLGRSLRFGRLAGALALLCQRGCLDEAEALAVLARIEDRDAATADIWRRMRPRPEVDDPAEADEFATGDVEAR